MYSWTGGTCRREEDLWKLNRQFQHWNTGENPLQNFQQYPRGLGGGVIERGCAL